MRNTTIDAISTKVLQLEAMLSVLSNMTGSLDKLSEDEICNYTWVMSDLVGEIKVAIKRDAEVRNVA